MGFDRGQEFSGKECIHLYTEYMQHRFAHRDEEASKLRNYLLSHNADDLQGTALCTELLLYTDPKIYAPSLTLAEDRAVFTDHLPEGTSYPVSLSYDTELGTVQQKEDTLTVTIPLLRDTLYHFFPDYKNYFYLPEEDMAVHKSVGSFVDSAHRKQATASTCYVKKEGTFLPIRKDTHAPEKTPVFHKKNAPKGACYIEAYSASAEMISFLL